MLKQDALPLTAGYFSGFMARHGGMLTSGWFWGSGVQGGYSIYRGKDARENIDYDSAIAACSAVTSLAIDQSDLEADATYYYGIRAVSNYGTEDNNNDVYLRIKTDASSDYVARPNSPQNLTATAGPGGTITLNWRYYTQGQNAAPDKFVIYCDNGTGTVDLTYANKLDEVGFRQGDSYTTAALTNATMYKFIVRAKSADGNEDTNTNQVVAAADSVGPEDITGISVEVVA